jgi:intracellular septation protein A
MMIAIFDLGGPLITYFVLRDFVGLSTVLALVLSGVLPAVGVAITAIQYRRVDIFGIMVLVGILFGSVLGLTTHNARLYLAEGSVPSLAFSIACLASLRTRQPLIYRLALEFLGTGSKKGREIMDAWRYPVFQRAFRTITVVWGVGYIFEATIRLVVAETESTGIALVCSKGAPYAFATVLAVWTLVYGERRKNLAIAASPPAKQPLRLTTHGRS